MRDGGNAKSESSTSCRRTQQHILRLDIAVNEFLFVGILQGISYLLDRRDDDRERDQATFRVETPLASHWGHSRSPEMVHHPAHQ